MICRHASSLYAACSLGRAVTLLLNSWVLTGLVVRITAIHQHECDATKTEWRLASGDDDMMILVLSSRRDAPLSVRATRRDEIYTARRQGDAQEAACHWPLPADEAKATVRE